MFGVCIKNRGYPASLEVRKIYLIELPPGAARYFVPSIPA
jgi:hypothetical protein